MKLSSERTIDRIGTIGQWAFVTLVLALVFLYSLRPNWAIDIYWHIKVGE